MAREAQDATDQVTQASPSLVALDAPTAVTQVSPSLLSLGDDPLRHVLTFLSPADGRRGVGTAAKVFRAAASSAALARARGAEGYVLRGTDHGVVHALATACGTKRWPKRAVKKFSDELIDSMSAASDDEDDYVRILSAPPALLRIASHRDKNDILPMYASEQSYTSFFEAAVVHPGDPAAEEAEGSGSECNLAAGSFVEYQLPFKLRISHFRIGMSHCADSLTDWAFEAFDDELVQYGFDGWVPLHHNTSKSPWHYVDGGDPGQHKYFYDMNFVSSRFRIKLLDSTGQQCFHIRGFELFGTVLPPWRLD